MAKRIELWSVDRLVPYERNSRTHSPEQVAQIAASISEFGFVNPILVDSDDGVIAGHGRLAAAQDLGLDEVPVVVLDHLTPTQRKAYVIADNKLALSADWDMSMLQQEVAGLQLQEFDLELLGFDEKDLAELLNLERIDADQASEKFAEVDDDIETEHRCPSCGYEWSGKTK
jgi:ParB-like chromosome segregation protein Spo0J